MKPEKTALETFFEVVGEEIPATDFETYLKFVEAAYEKAGMPQTIVEAEKRRLEEFHRARLKKFEEQERSIVDDAMDMVDKVAHPFPTKKKQQKDENGEEKTISVPRTSEDYGSKMIQRVAEGPNLTILDGGPGAGKSYTLINAAAAMDVPVVCLGATPTAAKDLYKDVGKDYEANPVLGGLTVDQFLKPENDEQRKIKEEIEEKLKATPKPVFMVDEAGLLGHEQMAELMAYAKKNGFKMILAGDSQQIPPGKGQPFKTLTESLKGTPAYVIAPYTARSKDFAEKAITAGIYCGLSSSETNKIDEKVAVEFLAGAYAVTGGPTAAPKYGDKSFHDYVLEIAKKEGKPCKTAQQVAEAYVEYLQKKFEKTYAGYSPEKRKEKLASILKAGELPKSGGKAGEISQDDYDEYMYACMVAQQMGVQAYDVRGQIKSETDGKKLDSDEEILREAAKKITSHRYPDPVLEDGREKAIKKLVEEAVEKKKKELKKDGKELEKEEEEKLKKEIREGLKEEDIEKKEKKLIEEEPGRLFKEQPLVIVADEKEAQKLNNDIRQGKYGENPEILYPGEPILLGDGTKRLATKADVEAAKARTLGGEKGFRYAYAMDVTATQGMSHDGDVTFAVTGEGLKQMEGGHILVALSPNKGGKLDILVSQENKDKLYERSVVQRAGERVVQTKYPELKEKAEKFEKRAEVIEKPEEIRKEMTAIEIMGSLRTTSADYLNKLKNKELSEISALQNRHKNLSGNKIPKEAIAKYLKNKKNENN